MKKQIKVVVKGGVVQEIRLNFCDANLSIGLFDIDNLEEQGYSSNEIDKKYKKEIEPLRYGGGF